MTITDGEVAIATTDSRGTGADLGPGIPAVVSLPDRSVWAHGRRPLTTGLVLATSLIAFESLAVTTILPRVTDELGDLHLYGWAISAFVLAGLFGTAVASDLVDRLGVVTPMACGEALFAAGLLAAGAAPTMPVLVAGRALQGIGAGAISAVSYAAVARGYPEQARPRMVAVLSTAWVGPALVGPAAASAIASTLGWRAVFLGLVVPVLLAGGAAVRALRTVPTRDHPRTTRPDVLPVLGIVAGSGVALAALGTERSFLVGAGVVVGMALLAVSLRRIVPAGTLSARAGVPATVLTRGLATAAFYAVHAFVPFAIVTVRGAPLLVAAAAVSASTVTWVAAAWAQARLVTTLGPRRLVRLGEAVLAVGIVGMLVVVTTPAPAWLAVPAWAVGGAGMSLAYSPLAVTVMNAARDGEEGRAMSALQLLDMLGQMLGIGAAGAAVAAFSMGARPTPDGTRIAFGIGLAVAALALTVAHRLPKNDEPAQKSADHR